ncbi:MAG: hypothetical protein ACKORJ_11305 [Bacteroidota bacterium]
MVGRSTVIPKIFRDSSTGEPFRSCLMCERNLAEGVDYVIEKSIRNLPSPARTEVLFEYALCMDCAERMRKQLSKESLQRISAFFGSRVNMQERMDLISRPETSFRDCIGHCLITGVPIKKQREYSLYAQCQGSRLVYGLFPYAVSEAVMEEANELLSAKSREVLNGFIDRYFSGPPEIAAILRKRPVMI